MSSLHQTQTTKPRPRFSPRVTIDPDLETAALFAALGSLIALYVMIRYPEFGAIIAQCNQF
jgi:hypothetical protein